MADQDTDVQKLIHLDAVENGHPRRRSSDYEQNMLMNFFNYALNVGKGATGLISFGALYPTETSSSAVKFAFSTEEVRSLVRYASEEGINPELVSETYRKLRLCEQLTLNPSDVNALDKARVSLLKSYTELCHATKNVSGNVTGRTVKDSMQLSKHTARLVIITFSFLLWGLLAEAMGVYFAKNPTPISTIANCVWHFYEYGLRILNPFFWGGLGACVYVLKRSYDAARLHAFDTETYGGWGIRVVLGFVLGGAVLFIIDPSSISGHSSIGASETLDTKSGSIGTGISGIVIAFLTGLSTKIVYGALEKLIIEIASRFELDNTQPAKRSADAINEFLAGEIAKVDPQRDNEKYKLLVDLLSNRGKSSGAEAG